MIGNETRKTIADTRARHILWTAINLIDTHGWVQFKGGSEEIGFCATGAIAHASRMFRKNLGLSQMEAAEAKGAADNLLLQELRNHYGATSIISYNDTYGRTKAEVRLAMEKAAIG